MRFTLTKMMKTSNLMFSKNQRLSLVFLCLENDNGG